MPDLTVVSSLDIVQGLVYTYKLNFVRYKLCQLGCQHKEHDGISKLYR